MTETEEINEKINEEIKETKGSEIVAKFGIEQKILKNIICFLGDINVVIPTLLNKDGISINALSKDGKQYAEVKIKFSDLIYYDLPGMHELEKVEKKILIDIGNSSIENIDRIANIGREKDSLYDFYNFGCDVEIKDGVINATIYTDRVEFNCPGNIILLANVIYDQKSIQHSFKKIERLSGKIKKVRSDNNVKRASVALEPREFERICNMGIWADSTGCSINTDVFEMQIDNENGLLLSSRSNDGLYELRSMPEYLRIIECNNPGGASIFVNKKYIDPFNKLKVCHDQEGDTNSESDYIIIEITKGMPLILELVSIHGVSAVFTVSPIVKTC